MLAGIVFGPHTPGLALVEDPRDLALLASLGLVLLLFYLGLEFTLNDLFGGGRSLVAAGSIYIVLNIGGGLAFGFALGWGAREALVIAGAVAFSSSAIVTKLLVELRRLANPETRLILGSHRRRRLMRRSLPRDIAAGPERHAGNRANSHFVR
jgi:monovalent cation:H+ antiporter-2, CPA2 family